MPKSFTLRLLAVIAAAALLVMSGITVWAGTKEVGRTWNSARTDFFIFYNAGQVIGSPDFKKLYDPTPSEWGITMDPPPAVGNFFNPPFMACIYWLFAKLDYGAAQKVNFALSVLGGLAVAAFAYYWAPAGRKLFFFGLMAVIIATYWPTYISLTFGHPSLIFAALTGLAILEMQMAAPVSAGGYVGLLALKTTLFGAPLGLLLWKRRFQSAFSALAVAAVLIGVPFLVMGFDAIGDFRKLTSELTADAFRMRGTVTIGAADLLNWNGLWATTFRTDPPYAVMIPLYLMTIGLTLKVWTTGTLREGWFAGIATLMLSLPHLLAYDWVLLLPAAFALAFEKPTRPLLFMLVMLHLLVNVSVAQERWTEVEMSWFPLVGLLCVPWLFACIGFLAFRPQVEPWMERMGQRLFDRQALKDSASSRTPLEV